MRATDGLRPPGLPPLDREHRCAHLLRRTGLVTARGDGFAFISHTIGEVCGSRHHRHFTAASSSPATR